MRSFLFALVACALCVLHVLSIPVQIEERSLIDKDAVELSTREIAGSVLFERELTYALQDRGLFDDEVLELLVREFMEDLVLRKEPKTPGRLGRMFNGAKSWWNARRGKKEEKGQEESPSTRPPILRMSSFGERLVRPRPQTPPPVTISDLNKPLPPRPLPPRPPAPPPPQAPPQTPAQSRPQTPSGDKPGQQPPPGPRPLPPRPPTPPPQTPPQTPPAQSRPQTPHKDRPAQQPSGPRPQNQ
ncbi:hypothetical protein CC1G_08448 [Coprinopsis cinerea okayama7|uniref:Uncharacterized protein n=1 Tax=Coprinopsis cinerea (strain Okayama-7 / 130 / ATCC MYA-4618 / FGSC 9003) TaxID=240176 RepID=A8NLY6_COPC7|nr:hypothetical protein CC1G_08448 [Coprinopsis cinerea okayama7\|eukprot:XP_001834803.1 hypothetical protein CC1G_08448 [Coprinopsis cinerea okayama7\